MVRHDLGYVPQIHVELSPTRVIRGRLRLVQGSFASPHAGELPSASRTAHFWWLRPPTGHHEAVWVHLAGTGEGGNRRRLYLARPLAANGISSVILENPYYGVRAPSGQRGNDLNVVADLLRMCRAAVGEARCLLRWLGQHGHRARGVSGYSMGGHMASLAAATFPEPIACAAMASGRSAVPIFTADALSTSIRWDILGEADNQARDRLAALIELADLDRFPVPIRSDATILLGARRDAYVRCEQIEALHQHWPNSQLRWVGGGHVTTYVRRKPLVESLTAAMSTLVA